MAIQRNKYQNIRVAVGYNLSAAEDEPNEPARINVTVEGIRQDTGESVAFHRSVTVVDSSGEVYVEIPGVQNLQELSQVRAFATIEDGNVVESSGVVPEDPKVGKLQSVSLEGVYRKVVGSRQGSYDLTATVVLAEPVDEEVLGVVTLSQPRGASIPFVIPPHQVQTQVSFANLSLVDGTVAEVVAELTKNGLGTDNGTWEVTREHNRLVDFTLLLDKEAEATPTSPPRFTIQGMVVAELAFDSANGAWKITSGAPGSGTLAFSREMGGEDSFVTGAVPLKPNSTVEAEASVEDEDKTSVLTASVNVPDDEPNRIQSVQLTAQPEDPKNPFGLYRLRVTFVAIVPSGEGATVTASGAVGGEAAVAGQGTTGGSIDLGNSRTAVSINVSIDGGNSVTLQWKPPEPPKESETGREEEQPETETAEQTTAVPVGVTEPTQDQEKEKGVPARVRLLIPSDQIIVGSQGTLRFEILDSSGQPCPGKSVAWDFASSDSGSGNHGGFIPLDLRSGMTGADGQLETVYGCHSSTANFEPGAPFSETLEFTYAGRSIGEVTFYIAPPLSIRFRKELFADRSETVEYDPNLVKSGGGITLKPTISGEGEVWLGEAQFQVQHAEIFVNGAETPLEAQGGDYLVPIGSSSGSGEFSFLVHLDRYLDDTARQLVRLAKAVDQSIASRETVDPGVGGADSGGPGNGPVGQAAGPYLQEMCKSAAEFDPKQTGGPHAKDFAKRLSDTTFFLDHSLGIHRAFGSALDLNKLSFQRVRDNAAHLTMELLLFDPFREGLKVGVKTGLKKGVKEGSSEGYQLFAKELRKYYDDKVRKELAEAIVRQVREYREPLVESYRAVRDKIKKLIEVRDAARPLSESLEQLKNTLGELAEDLANWTQKKTDIEGAIGRLRAEFEQLKGQFDEIPVDQLRQARDRLSAIVKEVIQQQDLLKTQNAKIAQLTTRLATQTARQTDLDGQLKKILGQTRSGSLEELNDLIVRQTTQRDLLSRQIAEAAGEQISEESQRIAQEAEKLSQSVSRLRTLKQQADAAQAELSRATSAIVEAKREIARLEQQAAEMPGKIKDLEKSMEPWRRVEESAGQVEEVARLATQRTEPIRRRIAQLETDLAAANREIVAKEAAQKSAQDTIHQQNQALAQSLKDAGAESLDQLSSELSKQTLEQARLVASRDALREWRNVAQQLADPGIDPEEVLKRFVQLADPSRVDKEALRRVSRDIRAITDGVSDSDIELAYRAAVKEQITSILKSKYASGELSEVLARREQLLRQLLDEAPSKSKPILLADYEPFGMSDYFRFISDKLKSYWDSVASGLASIVRWLGSTIRSSAQYLLGDVYGAAVSDNLYGALAYLFRSLFGFLMFVIDLFLAVASGVRTVFNAVYEPTVEFLETERGKLISDVKSKGGCSPDFFFIEASNFVPGYGVAGAVEELKKGIERLLGGDEPTAAVKAEYVTYTDRAFTLFADGQRGNAERVITNLGLKALGQNWGNIAGIAETVPNLDWTRLRSLTRTIAEYEQDFNDPSGGREFWATWGQAVNKIYHGNWTAANLDQVVDWAAWIVAMLFRLVALVAIVSTPFTTVGGVAVGVFGLASAELADVIGALIKTTIAAIFTESVVRNYQEDVLLLHMKAYNELFP